MKVIYITHVAELYGANIAMYNLISVLRREYDVTPVVILPHKGELSAKLEENNIPYIVFKLARWQYPVGKKNILLKILYRCWNQIATVYLARRLKKEKVDIVHSNSSVMYAGVLLAEKIKCYHVWHIREIGRALEWEYIYSERFVQKMYRKSNKVIAISNYVYEWYKQMVTPDNMVRIYDGVFCNSEMKTNFANGTGAIRFCSVGLLSRQKNQLNIVRACIILVENGITNFELFLVGDGNEIIKQRIEEVIQEYHLEKQIIMQGYCDNIPMLLEKMDVGISASHHEAFGLATAEYMAAAMPVIGAASGATMELIQDGVNGYLYPYENDEMLAERMKRFITDPSLIKEYGERAYDYIKNNFDIKKNARSVYECYIEST